MEGKRVLVVGLARSGSAAADLLHRRGAVVMVSDSRPPWSFAHEMPRLLAAKIGLEFGQHGVETALAQDLIVVSPGVPWDLPALVAARERGVPVVAEVEAGSWFLHGDLVAVTGSNGKTTTTTLIGRMLESSGIHTMVGGNIGVPLTSMVDETTDESAVVVELSSFQLEGTESLHPRVAVILNITPNHLDRHPSLEAYVDAKARILRNQTADDYAVLNADDPVVMSLADRVRAQKVFFSRIQDLSEGLLISEGKVVYRIAHLERELFSPRDVRLRGLFNLENVLAASAAACVVGADFDVLGKAVREFRGVEHRLESVGEVMGVEFYNDSKATSVDAAVKALGAFDRGVHLILGGKDKGAPYAPLVPLLRGRVREVLLIGAAAERIAAELADTVELIQAGDLESATRQAFQRARAGDVVLLSPACSSYDQFQDFEHRGRVFRGLVETLAREGEAARANRPRPAPKSVPPKPQARPKPVTLAQLVTGEFPVPAVPASGSAPQPAQLPSPTQATSTVEPAAKPFGATPPVPVDRRIPAPAAGEPGDSLAASTVAPAAGPVPQERAEAIGGELVDRAPAAQPSAEHAAKVIADLPREVVDASIGAPEPQAGGRLEGAAEAGTVRELQAAPQPERVLRVQPVEPERIYVYEMDAEERPPLDLPEIPLDDMDFVPARKNDASVRLDSIALGEHEHEPLIFEVSPSAARSLTSQPAGSEAADRSTALARRKKRSKAAENTPEGEADSQDRFPGT
jgi:UDP-N-acetylmuramoylalanine--D-glutamate ligase